MNKFKGIKIGTKFTLFVIAVILFLSITIGIVAMYQIEKVMTKVYTDRVKVVSTLGYNWFSENYPGDWSIKNNELYKGNIKINDNSEFVDKIGKITNGAVTVFQGDTRVSTNIKVDGQRRNGTKADPKVTEIVLKSGKEYLGEADIVGTKYITMYRPIKDKNGDIIGMWLMGPPVNTISETVMSLITMFSITLIIIGCIAVGFSMLFIRGMVRPIRIMNEQLKDIAEGEGDLTKEVSIKSKDEIGELANSFNKMISSLRTMIQQISFTSEQVAASSEELTASTEQTKLGTDQIATSIQEVAIGADAQGQGANESSKAMQEITINIQQVSETVASVSGAATETSQEAYLGNESLQQVIKQMTHINEAVNESSSVIKQLGEHSKEIGKIIEAITGIADQTNLLALNAAIEAARAGEHGKGFAVVADEVRKLAEQSKESADHITTLINQIQRDTTHAVDVMDKGTKEMVVGMEVVHETGDGFQRILKSIEHVTGQVQEVTAISEEIAAGAEQVNASIEEMANIAQTSASNTQNVASAAEEQLASMEEILLSSSSLSNMAEDLQLLIKKFKI